MLYCAVTDLSRGFCELYRVRCRMRVVLVSIALVILLTGCASCWTVDKLRPSVAETPGFAASSDANLDSLFLEGDRLSLWLKPCEDRSSKKIDGSLCGMFIVPPKRRFILRDATIQLMALSSRHEWSIYIVPLDFKLDDVETGYGEPASKSWLVNRPYQLTGSWLSARFLERGAVNSSSELRLPAMEVDGESFKFPPIFVTPTRGETCVHYH